MFQVQPSLLVSEVFACQKLPVCLVFANNHKTNCFHPLSFVFGAEESEDGPLHLEAQEEHPVVDSRQQKAGRRRRGAWGKRKHAATVESTAYRMVSYRSALPCED